MTRKSPREVNVKKYGQKKKKKSRKREVKNADAEPKHALRRKHRERHNFCTIFPFSRAKCVLQNNDEEDQAEEVYFRYIFSPVQTSPIPSYIY